MATGTSLKHVVRFLRDESGQDVVETALLAAFIGTTGILAWTGITTGLGDHYAGWGSGVEGLSACTPDPGGSCITPIP